MKNEKLYTDQILDSVRKIELFLDGINKEKFLTDPLIQSGVILQLILIGEISKRISDETKSRIDVPWKKMIGFRDKTIHNYFDANLDIVWDTTQEDLNILKEKLK